MTTTNEIRPGWETEADQDVRATNGFSLAAGDRLAQFVQGVFVTVVQDDRGHARRKIYLSLAAAQHAVERARDRGHEASVVLCQLQPVGVISE